MSPAASLKGPNGMGGWLKFPIFALVITIGGLKVPALDTAWELGLPGLLIMGVLIEISMLVGIFRFIMNKTHGFRMIYLALWVAIFESIYVMSSCPQEMFDEIVRINSIIEIIAALLLGLMVLYQVISNPK